MIEDGLKNTNSTNNCDDDDEIELVKSNVSTKEKKSEVKENVKKSDNDEIRYVKQDISHIESVERELEEDEYELEI